MTPDELLALYAVFVVTGLLIWLVRVAESEPNQSGRGAKHDYGQKVRHHRQKNLSTSLAPPSLLDQQWNVSSFFAVACDDRRQKLGTREIGDGVR